MAPEREPATVAAALGVPAARFALLEHLRAVGGATASQCAAATGYSPGTLRGHLRALENLGIITRSMVRTPACPKPVVCWSWDDDQAEDVAWALFEAVGPTGKTF